MLLCESGGTGRRARLRGVWFTPYGFKSRFSHQNRKNPAIAENTVIAGFSYFIGYSAIFGMCTISHKIAQTQKIFFRFRKETQPVCNHATTMQPQKGVEKGSVWPLLLTLQSYLREMSIRRHLVLTSARALRARAAKVRQRGGAEALRLTLRPPHSLDAGSWDARAETPKSLCFHRLFFCFMKFIKFHSYLTAGRSFP